MKHAIAFLLIAASLAHGAHAAPTNSVQAATLSDKDRIDLLIRQNTLLTEANERLIAQQREKPASKEETFASCMQAARGQTSAMVAESIGGHCDQLLKK
ncbi:hypothetical protein FNU76_02875 [Chitinimonas arctica]|uniref:Secreted protein n=1 Tax=Chitinimonas arctica TaxID=2594795 RepID=A0A516SB58_9NEIS|nr:hypothetical protein [Chitinimonas arctica]QDQ25382.1 hypothetical protein FNU76_02875 [Chitinimonas arctica]